MHGKTVVFNSAIVHNCDRRAERINVTFPAVLRVYFLGVEQWMLPLVLVWARISSVAEAGRQPDFSRQSPDWPGSETLNRVAYSVLAGVAPTCHQ